MATAAQVVVTGEVDAALNIPAETTDPANTGGLNCSDSSGNATFAITDGWESAATVTGNCNINFGSTNGQVRLTYENANAGATFYCNHPGGGARDCTTGAGVNTVANVGAGAAITTNTFGIALNDTPVNATQPPSGVTEDANNNAIAADTNTWYPIPASGAPAELCRSAAAGTATCQIRFGLQGRGAAPLQNPGVYDGTLQLTLAAI